MRRLWVALVCGTLLGWGIDSRSARGQVVSRSADHATPGATITAWQSIQLAGGPRHHHHHGGGILGWNSNPLGIGGLLYWPAAVPFYPATRVIGYSFTLPATSSTPAASRVAPPAPQPSDDAPAVPRKPNATNAEQKARAGRFIGFGDSQFEQQKYLAALGRYKTAMATAPDLPESYLRMAFARVAIGQYEEAAKAYRRGLAVQSNWRGSPLRLDDLYGPAPLSKNAHTERLARAVEQNPFDAELLFVLGLQLFFDGQRDRGQVFLTRAAQLGANETGLLNDFLPQPKPASAPDAPPVDGKIVF